MGNKQITKRLLLGAVHGDFVESHTIGSQATYSLNCGANYAVVIYQNRSTGAKSSFGMVAKAADGIVTIHPNSDGNMTVSDGGTTYINFTNTDITSRYFTFRVFFLAL